MDLEIHNHYETLVKQAIREKALHLQMDEDQLTDLACLTLNQLPARYIRYKVDMTGFASETEIAAMEAEIQSALKQALQFLENHPRQEEL